MCFEVIYRYLLLVKNFLSRLWIEIGSSKVHDDVNEEHGVDDVVNFLCHIVGVVGLAPVESGFHR